jgi:hypothetical protein
MLKGLITLLFCAVVALVVGQTSAVGFNRDPLSALDFKVAKYPFKQPEHEGIQPAAKGIENQFIGLVDSVRRTDVYGSTFETRPVFNLGAGFGKEGATFGNYAGAGLFFHHKDKLYIEAQYAMGLRSGTEFTRQFGDSLNILPGMGFARKAADGAYFAHIPSGSISYKAGKYFHFELGNGKHFWGFGYRSLILGDHGAPMPYFRLTTRVWKVKYTSLFLKLKDISTTNQLNQARGKYAALHSLSWNATSRLNFSIYEMVIWQDRDTLNRRNLDLNYLNPLLFYRPVEFAQGSADNVLIGAGARYRVSKNTTLYAQFILDEFLLKEIREKTGWWANKYGGQLGLKAVDVIIPGLGIQSEVNAVRPFTYTHGSPVQAWGHLNQPLAHPLGANFYEWVNFIGYRWKKWRIREQFTWATFGRDENGQNLGGNVFQSYASPSKPYDNFTLQGDRHIFHYHELLVSRELEKLKGWEVYASHGIRWDKSQTQKTFDHWIMFGVRVTSDLWSRVDY